MADSFGAQFRLSSCLPFQRLRGGSAALTQCCSSQAGQLGPNLSAFTANSAQEGQVPGGTDRRPSTRTRVRNTKGRKRWTSPGLHNTQLQGVCRRRSLATIPGARKPRHLVNVEVAAIARTEQPHTPPRSQVTPTCGVSLPARPVAAYLALQTFPQRVPSAAEQRGRRQASAARSSSERGGHLPGAAAVAWPQPALPAEAKGRSRLAAVPRRCGTHVETSSLQAPLRAAPKGGGGRQVPFRPQTLSAPRKVTASLPHRCRRCGTQRPTAPSFAAPLSSARGSPRRPPSLRPLRSAAVRGEDGEIGELSERQGDTRAALPPPARPPRQRALRLGAAGAGPLPLPAGSSRAPSPLSPRGPFLRVAASGNKSRTGASRRSGLRCSSSPSAERGARLRPARPEVRPCSRRSPSAAAPGAPGPPVPSAPALLHLPRCRAVPAARAEERRGHPRSVLPQLLITFLRPHSAPPRCRPGARPHAGRMHRRRRRPSGDALGHAGSGRPSALPLAGTENCCPAPRTPSRPIHCPAPRTATSCRRGRCPVPASGGWDPAALRQSVRARRGGRRGGTAGRRGRARPREVNGERCSVGAVDGALRSVDDWGGAKQNSS